VSHIQKFGDASKSLAGYVGISHRTRIISFRDAHPDLLQEMPHLQITGYEIFVACFIEIIVRRATAPAQQLA
jgi:hypothetical protein